MQLSSQQAWQELQSSAGTASSVLLFEGPGMESLRL